MSDVIITPNRGVATEGKIEFYSGATPALSGTISINSGNITITPEGSGQVQVGKAGGTTTIPGDLSVTGNLTINGTTTTVNSTTVTIDDPVFTLGGDAAPSSDDNKDRGIDFRWHNGTSPFLGFMGWDDSEGAFALWGNASESSGVYSTGGTAGRGKLYIGDTLRMYSNQATDSNYHIFGAASASAVRTITIPDATGTIALTANKLSVFAATTSSELAGVISDETGSGALVFATSPTLVTPLLGTPTSGNLSNCTNIPMGQATGTLAVANGGTGITSFGTGIATFLGTPSSANLAAAVTDETGSGALVFANTPTLVTPNIGAATGTSLTATGGGVLARAAATQDGVEIRGRAGGTGNWEVIITPATLSADRTLTLPDATGTVALTSNNLSVFAATTSSQLAGVISDETGSGALVFATSPTLVTPLLGTPTSGNLSNCTNIPMGQATGTLAVANGGTGITSFGTGIATFLGTPSSANLAAAVTDETGSGALVFGTSPSLTTPSLSGETFSTSATVTAGTNAQGQGALTSDYNIITTTGSNPSGVTLPTATTGRRIYIVNKGTNAINVYPATGGFIDGLAQNASIQIAVNGILEFNASSTTQWYSTANAVLGAITPTSVNGLTITSSTGTLTIANSKTLTVSNTLTFTGTDSSSVAFGAGGTVAYTSNNLGAFAATTSSQLAGVISDETGSGALVFATSPTLTTPTLGVASATSINKVAITAPATSATLTIADGKTLTASNTLTFTGTDTSSVAFGTGGTVAYTANKLSVFAATTSSELAGVISDETGTGVLVFGTSPSFTTGINAASTTMALFNATATTINMGAAATAINIGASNGTVTFGYNVVVNNKLEATTKSFVIDHPTKWKEGMKLRYACLEGPENGVYVRGVLTDDDTIELPEYWVNLVDANSITVNLTPMGSSNGHYVKSIKDNVVTVGSRSGNINCHYIIYGERKDVSKLVVEYHAAQ